MYLAELIEAVESMIDDCAANGGVPGARRLAATFLLLSWAADSRCVAIECRLRGDIDAALTAEQASDKYITGARKAANQDA